MYCYLTGVGVGTGDTDVCIIINAGWVFLFEGSNNTIFKNKAAHAGIETDLRKSLVGNCVQCDEGPRPEPKVEALAFLRRVRHSHENYIGNWTGCIIDASPNLELSGAQSK